MLKVIFLSISLCLLQGEKLNGVVVGVTDGDTITVLVDDERIKVRLEGIDCPESNQDFGTKAKQVTSTLCFNKSVTVVKTGTDRYGRTLGHVYVGETSVNKELLRLGMAWHYKKYNSDASLSEIEIEAKRNKIGLWSQENAIAPWDFRRLKQ